MTDLAGRVVIEEFDSAALRGNPLGDPARRPIPVYLPPGYEPSTRRFPVIYWLHGFTGTALSQLNRHAWIPSVPELIDRVIVEGAAPVILVMADGNTTYGGSQFINSSYNGRYEDATLELVEFIDRRYRTLPGREHRGLDGKSSGGYAALVLAMRHPDVFGAAASHSGDVYFEACYGAGFWTAADAIRKYGGAEGLLRAFREAPKKPDDISAALATAVAMAMAYSPNSDHRGGFDLPFDVETGELDEAVFARWLAWDPARMAVTHADALRSLRLLYFECGSRDQFNSHFGARYLDRTLHRLGVPHEYQEFDDDHTSVNYRYVESFRRLCAVL